MPSAERIAQYGRSRATLDATGRRHRTIIRPVSPRRTPWSSILEEEGRASHPPGEMRSVSKGAHNKWKRAIRNGGLRRQKVWLVTAAGGGKRGGEHNNQPNEGRTGCRATKCKDSNGREGGGGGDCGGEGDGGGVCCGEVRGNGGDDNDDDDNNDDRDDGNDHSCGVVGEGCGDGDSGGEGEGAGDGCSECDGDCGDDGGCRSNGVGPQWLR